MHASRAVQAGITVGPDVLGVETREQVDELAGQAEAAGGTPVGAPRNDGYRYQRGFTDLDGHHWEVLCLIEPAS